MLVCSARPYKVVINENSKQKYHCFVRNRIMHFQVCITKTSKQNSNMKYPYFLCTSGLILLLKFIKFWIMHLKLYTSNSFKNKINGWSQWNLNWKKIYICMNLI